MTILFVLFQLVVALAVLEDLGSCPEGVDYEMNLSGVAGILVAVGDMVEMIMEAVVIFLVEVVVLVAMEKVITKGEGEVAGQVDKNKMLFLTEILMIFRRLF